MSDLIPRGTYEAVAYVVDTEEFGQTYAQFGESKNKGTPQVVVNFEIVSEGEQAGRRIAWIGYFPPDNQDVSRRTVESLRYCGFTGNDLATAVTQTLDKKVQIVIDHEQYDGKTRAKVQWVNRAGGGAYRLTEGMKGDALRRFAAQMKAVVQSTESGAPRPAAGSQARPGSAGKHRDVSAPPRDDRPPPSDDSDIPF
jgi:hypothetical protein